MKRVLRQERNIFFLELAGLQTRELKSVSYLFRETALFKFQEIFGDLFHVHEYVEICKSWLNGRSSIKVQFVCGIYEFIIFIWNDLLINSNIYLWIFSDWYKITCRNEKSTINIKSVPNTFTTICLSLIQKIFTRS